LLPAAVATGLVTGQQGHGEPVRQILVVVSCEGVDHRPHGLFAGQHVPRGHAILAEEVPAPGGSARSGVGKPPTLPVDKPDLTPVPPWIAFEHRLQRLWARSHSGGHLLERPIPQWGMGVGLDGDGGEAGLHVRHARSNRPVRGRHRNAELPTLPVETDDRKGHVRLLALATP
jgi:hypothetical protein